MGKYLIKKGKGHGNCYFRTITPQVRRADDCQGVGGKPFNNAKGSLCDHRWRRHSLPSKLHPPVTLISSFVREVFPSQVPKQVRTLPTALKGGNLPS